MKQYVKTSAVIIKIIPWQNAGKLLTLFTRERALVSVIAHSSTRLLSPYLGKTELFQEIDICIDYNDTKDIHFIKELELKKDYSKLSTDFTRFSLSNIISELLQKTLIVHDDFSHLYDIYSLYLGRLNLSQSPFKETIQFLLYFITDLGFDLDFKVCNNCHSPLTKQYQFHLKRGILCENCLEINYSNLMLPNYFVICRELAHFEIIAQEKKDCSENEFLEIFNLLLIYLNYHQQSEIKIDSLKLIDR